MSPFVFRIALFPFAATSLLAQQPDLVVAGVDPGGVTGDWQALTISGSVAVDLGNVGAGATGGGFDVVCFEDSNGNGTYEAGTDALLGSAVAPAMAAGATQLLAVPVAGAVSFRENLIFAFADASQTIAEANEANNLADTGAACSFVPPPGPLLATLEWSWTSSTVEPNALNVMMTPAVADLDGDGVPEVIFGATASTGGAFVEVGFLRALDGATGTELFTQTDPLLRVNTAASLAVGDLDGDGAPEIVACDDTGARLICFEQDGSFKWRSGTLTAINWGAVSIADLDQDGSPEVIVGNQVLDAGGNLLWTGTGGTGGDSVGPISLVADVDNDGTPNLVTGRTVYAPNGAIVFDNPGITDGTVGVANFDADALAEIVSVSGGVVRMVKLGPGASLTLMDSEVLPGGGFGGPPTIADYDADGLPEIGVAGATRYTVYDCDPLTLQLTQKWAAVTQDGSSNRTGSSVFDFDGDGSAEVVYRDELNLRIYRGTDGTVLFQVPMSSCTWYEYVHVVDVDADGNAEIVAVANNNCGFGPERGVFVFGATNDDWVATRRVWNQHSYHITNVAEDGTIPQFEANNWLTPPAAPFNNFRQNLLSTSNPTAAPDATASFLRASTGGAQETVTARVGNGGGVLLGAGLPVSYYDGDPSSGGLLLGTTTTSGQLAPGTFEDVTLVLAGSVPPTVFAVADDAGGSVSTQNECDETNNTHGAQVLVALFCPPDLVEVWTNGPANGQTNTGHTGVATFVDSCDPNPLLSFADVLDPGDLPGEPETIVTRTWSLQDVCGNSLQCDQRITLLSPSFGSSNLELDLGGCQDVLEREARSGTLELVLLGRANLALDQVKRQGLRLRRMDAYASKVAPIDASAALDDEAVASATTLGQCNPAGNDGREDLRLVFDRAEVVQRLGLGSLPAGSQVCLVLTGRRTNGTPFYAATLVDVR